MDRNEGMRFRWMNLWMALLLFLCLSGQAAAAEGVEVTAEQVKGMMDRSEALVVFPLSAIEFNNLHIPGSINIPLEELQDKLPPDKERKIVFYCLGRT